MKVVVTGATGLVGRNLIDSLIALGDQVVALSRNVERAKSSLPQSIDIFQWNPKSELPPAASLEGSDAVVNLVGEPVAQRWSENAKLKIFDSRVFATNKLIEGIEAVSSRPKTLVNISAIGYYGARGDEIVDEATEPANDFLAEVTKNWEESALTARELGLRVVILRTGIVLSNNGGALMKMLAPFKLGLGGPIGSGKQYMSWITLADLISLIITSLGSENYRGTINATAPNPVSNREFSKELGKVLGRPSVVPVPPFVLRLMFGEMSQILTTGARVVPKRATELGFKFWFPDLGPALTAILGKPGSSS